MKNITRLVILFLAVLSFAGHAHNVTLPKAVKDMSLQKVTDNVYVVHGIHAMPDKDNQAFISNSGIVVSDEGVVIIDTGGSLQIGEMLLNKVKEVTDKPVIAVFNTHLHGDHWLGNAAIRKAYPDARIYAHERAIERLQNGEAEQWLDIFMQADCAARHRAQGRRINRGGREYLQDSSHRSRAYR
jgi:glyoxylase-like metal-dependent hydrolase (beta-lactamase superfamily II)